MASEILAGMENGDRSAVLAEARRRYGNVSASDLWHYIYATFHAPDWRERFGTELENSPPRFPWVASRFFAAFRDAGAELMGLHADYDRAPQHPDPVVRIEGDGDCLIAPSGMSWAKKDGGGQDLTCIRINPAAMFADIPLEAHDYQVAGHSPLQWAVATSEAGEEPGEDPGVCWPQPGGLEAHLRRLTYIGVRTAEVAAMLPPSLTEYEGPR